MLFPSMKNLFLASHSEAIVRGYRTRAIWMEKGSVHADGRPEDALPEYAKWMSRTGA
jgi:ABC-type polysaccharide/polyol phosphate transport system ATPase subunit